MNLTRVRSLATLVSNYLTHSLTHSLTPWHLVDLTDVSLANSKLEVVTVADVDAEKRETTVGADLDIKLNFCSDFEHKVCLRF